MSFFKKILEKIRQSEDLSDIRSSSFRDILNGNILTKKFFRKQLYFIILLVFIAIAYIDNRYACEKQIEYSLSLKRKIQDAKYESLVISAELMKITTQTNIQNLLESKGMKLKPGKTPPIVIE
ncbi:hypothetical protein MASR2M117_24620 [Paludibacter sp.]